MTTETMPRDAQALLKAELDDACDFDPRDPFAGLKREDLEGSSLSRRTVLRMMAAAGTLSAAQLLPGVGGEAEAAGKMGGTLTCGWAGTGQIQTLDPAQINQVLEFQITSNVLSGLTHINPKLIGEPDLAESWTVSKDGKEYIFKLRKGVTFHNGDPFSADDVVYTFQRSKDPQKSIQSRVLKNVSAVEKIDDTTVRFLLSAPDASFFVKTLERSSGRAMTIVCRGAIEKMGLQKYGLMPVGTGPFRVTYHQLGQGVVLEKFAHYYDPQRPKLDKVIIKPIIDNEPLAAAIEAGDIQLIGGNPPAAELIDRFLADRDIVVSIVPGPGFQSLWLNPWREPFRVTDFNKPMASLMQEKGFKVRLAIAKAIDRELYLKQAQFGRGYPAYGSINPAMKYYFEDLSKVSAQRYDLKEARKLLAEAGFPNGRGFPRMKLIHLPSGRREAEIVKAMLKRNLNIDIALDARDASVALDAFLKMDFDMIRIGSGGDYDPDDGLVDWMETHSKFNGLRRDKKKMPFGYFSDREVDKLTEAERIETDLKKRRELVQKANLITSNKVACAFIYHPIDALVHRKNVHFPAASRIPGLVDLDRTTIS